MELCGCYCYSLALWPAGHGQVERIKYLQCANFRVAAVRIRDSTCTGQLLSGRENSSLLAIPISLQWLVASLVIGARKWIERLGAKFLLASSYLPVGLASDLWPTLIRLGRSNI